MPFLSRKPTKWERRIYKLAMLLYCCTVLGYAIFGYVLIFVYGKFMRAIPLLAGSAVMFMAPILLAYYFQKREENESIKEEVGEYIHDKWTNWKNKKRKANETDGKNEI